MNGEVETYNSENDLEPIKTWHSHHKNMPLGGSSQKPLPYRYRLAVFYLCSSARRAPQFGSGVRKRTDPGLDIRCTASVGFSSFFGSETIAESDEVRFPDECFALGNEAVCE